MDLKLSTREVKDVSIIDAAGRITRGEGVDAFRAQIAQLVKAGRKKILVNLKEVSFVDSSGIGVLVAAVTQVKCNSCGVVYSNLALDQCPECKASADNSEMNVNAAGGHWTPPWGDFRLLFPNKKVEDLLRVTKLYEAFRVYHDERIAVDSFR